MALQVEDRARYVSETTQPVTSDEAVLREFMTTSRPRLVKALASWAGSWAAAEDAVATATERSVGRDQLDTVGDLERWVYVVARNEVRTAMRRESTWLRVRHLVPVGRTQGTIDATPESLWLLRLVRRLPPRQREVTALFYYLDYSIEDISKTLDVSPGAVKNALHNAREALRLAVAQGENAAAAQEEG